MSEAFQEDVRNARHQGVFMGRVFLTCENARCAIVEVVLKVHEGPQALKFQLPLLCCRCRQPLSYHELQGG
jgi:hypothetical protein